MDSAKASIAPGSRREDWSSTTTGSSSASSVLVKGDQAVAINGRVFHDNVARVAGSSFDKDVHGDSLPHTPIVLTGLMDAWPAFSQPGVSWSVQDLAARTTDRVSLDGGPGFARMSMCSGKVTIQEYQRYCENLADGDSAPLYVFDPDILTSTFAHDEDDDKGSPVSDAFITPACFSNDAMSCISGSQYRPLPPAWLLVGVNRSGTPIHDHPLTVAWNALLVGCKLWCCLPPDVDEKLLLLNLEFQQEDNMDAFDLSAIDWFSQCGELPESAKIIVQHPGETVYLPNGWFHVVLNVETSTAISVSLALRRDLHSVLPLLMESDEEFATFWVERLLRFNKNSNSNISEDSNRPEESPINEWIPASVLRKD